MGLRFHWRLPQGGERNASRAFQASLPETGLPDLEAQTEFCRVAEECGIDGLLVDFGWAKPDPMLLAAALGKATAKVTFIVAYRSGLMSPTTFAHQVNTLSALIGGRVSLNIVAGHSPEEQRYFGDFLSHDDRYRRTDEFLEICNLFWSRAGDVNFSGAYYKIEGGKLNTSFVSPDRTSPEVYVAGNSPQAMRVALKRGTCWMRIGDSPERMRSEIRPVLDQGKEVGVRMSVIARPTRDEALRAAYSLIEGYARGFDDRAMEANFVRKSDSFSINNAYRLSETEWLTSRLWTGAVRTHGAPAIAIVGTAEDVASTAMEYAEIGVSQFILSGWPKLEEMVFFGREVLPIIRRNE